MKKGWIVVIFFIFCTSLKAASPLFHATIGEKWMEAFEEYDEKQKRAFMLGTLFPDIRYLAGLPRGKTHEHGLSIREILETRDPFLKGMRVHAFVDEMRENFLKTQSVFEVLENVKGDKSLFLKMLEDEVLYLHGEASLRYISDYFNAIIQEELQFPVAQEVLEKWHKIHISYFRKRPSELFAQLVKEGKGFGSLSFQAIQGSYEVMLQFGEDEQIKHYVLESVKEFDRIFQPLKRRTFLLKK